MRQLLSVVLLLLCFAYGGIAGFARDLPEAEGDLLRTYVPYRRESDAGAGEWKPLRIAVNMVGVLDKIKGCNEDDGSEYKRAGNKRGRSSFGGGICGEIGETGVEEALRFSRKVVPRAVKLHADRLLVRRGDGPLRMLEDGGNFPNGACADVSVNPDDLKHGVSSADVVVFVGLTSSSTTSAEVCRYDKHRRPTVVSIKLRPRDIRGGEERHVRLFAHEIAHAIGFDSIRNPRYVGPDMGERVGAIVYQTIDDEEIRKVLQESLGCRGGVSVLKMVRAKDGRNRLHFPESLVKGELMSPYDGEDFGTRSMVYSPLTLAVFEATGLYKADFDSARDLVEWYQIPRVNCRELNEYNE